MATTYYLPCSCGKNLEVGVRLAGQSIRCTCGVELDVPTLRGLRELEPADTTDESTATPVWGLGQGIIFIVGMTLTVGATIAIVIFWQQMIGVKKDYGNSAEKPVMDNVHYEFDFTTMTPERSLDAWEFLSSHPLPESRNTPDFLEYRRQTGKLKRYMAISAALVAVGAVALCGAVLLKPRQAGAL